MEDFVIPNIPSRCTWSKNADPATNPHQKIPTAPRQKIYPDILSTVGSTPLVRLNKIPQSEGIKCEILVKCEFFNPAGSVKDRIAVRMIEDAERKGILKPGMTLVEPSSGNTGIAMALAAAIKGYRCIIVMPEKMSNEKVDVLKALGAEVIRTPTLAGSNSPDGLVGTTYRIHRETPGSIILGQWSHEGNPLAHYDTTAAEIYEACDGKIDMIVAGAGTGGTLTGLGRWMKEKRPSCKVIGVDPDGSLIARPESLNQPGKFWEIEGIGYDFAATVLDHSVVDEWIKVSDEMAFPMAKRLIKEEGLLCGGSSGAHLAVALKAAKNLNENQRCVVILADSIRNYLTKFVSDAWMEVRNLQPCPNLFNHWWWDHKVTALNLQPPISLLPTSSCSEASNLMRKMKLEQIPIVAKNGKFEGVATLKELMKLKFLGKIESESPISRVMPSKCLKFRNDTSLGLVSKAMEVEGFAVVVKGDEGNEELIGLITPLDLLQYVESNDCNTECSRKSKT